MVSRQTSCIPKEEVGFPRVLYCDSRCSQTCRRRFQVLPRLSSVLPGLSPALPCAFRLVDGTSRLVTSASRCSQVYPKFSPVLQGVPKLITITHMVLPYQLSEIPVRMKAGRNALLEFDTLLKLTHLSLDSTFSQTLLEASSD